MEEPTDDRLQTCMELFALHQRRLYAFVQAMLPSPADAEEVVQETNIVIWRKFEQFDPNQPNSDFFAWAYRIASLQVRDYIRRQGRLATRFSPEVLDQLIEVAEREQPVLEQRREALNVCLDQLPWEDRDLLLSCYAPRAKVSAVAERLQRTTTSVYRSLRRIRRMLSDCIDRREAAHT